MEVRAFSAGDLLNVKLGCRTGAHEVLELTLGTLNMKEQQSGGSR